MDCPLPVVPDDGGLRWSDSRSMDSSDEAHSPGSPSPWLGSFTKDSTSVSVSSSIAGFAHTGQLSPISNGVDLPCGPDRSAATSLASPSQSPPAAPSSAQAPSLIRTFGLSALERDSPLPHASESHGRRGSDEVSTAPKLEPLEDDDFRMDDLQEAPSPAILNTLPSHLQGPPGQPMQKRPRGRPRKHPLMPNLATKVTKGRSKTGCLTCRRRKKKCDEAKPRCMNCEKNAVVCEGYPEKQIWKSGKERSEEERRKSGTFSITMHPLFPGLETAEDRVFWKHYNEHLSTVLTVEGEHRNAFKDVMIPIAVKHQGLMHSILSLASKHIDFDTPYGFNILKNNPNTTVEALRERSAYHHDQARLKFYHDVEFTNGKQNTDDKTLISARYGQMLCFLLEALVEGSSRGEHRLHLTVYRNLISTSPPDDSRFVSFISEVFQYYLFADELLHSSTRRDDCSSLKELPPIPSSHTPRLLGVTDGLLHYLSEITAMRNTVRHNMMAGVDPPAGYQLLYRADDIYADLKTWPSHWPAGDSRGRVSQLYVLMLWVYLHRTAHPPSLSTPASLASSVASVPGIHSSPSHGRPPASSAVNTPPHSASTSCVSSPSPKPAPSGGHAPSNPRSSGPHARIDSSSSSHPHDSNPDTSEAASTTAGTSSSRANSPPPIRRPLHLDPYLTDTVEQSLSLLESFKPSDPCQTLLLLPCFLVGTACFTPAQQRRVRAAVRSVWGYTGLRNVDRVAEVLEEVWRLMEAGEWVAAWDWAGAAGRLGLDFIPA